MASTGPGREGYHHGNLREALIRAALDMISERGLAGFAIAELARVLGVSPAAPYRHFRDRNALLAEVSRRGFEQLGSEMEDAAQAARIDPAEALCRAAQAHLAFAGRDQAVYAAMFEPALPWRDYPDLVRAREAAFAVVQRAARSACDQGRGRRPPATMVALHVWSLTHGIAGLFAGGAHGGPVGLPMPAGELLEAGLLVYLQALAIAATAGP